LLKVVEDVHKESTQVASRCSREGEAEEEEEIEEEAVEVAEEVVEEAEEVLEEAEEVLEEEETMEEAMEVAMQRWRSRRWKNSTTEYNRLAKIRENKEVNRLHEKKQDQVEIYTSPSKRDAQQPYCFIYYLTSGVCGSKSLCLMTLVPTHV